MKLSYRQKQFDKRSFSELIECLREDYDFQDSNIKKLSMSKALKLCRDIKESSIFDGYTDMYYDVKSKYMIWYEPEYVDHGWIWNQEKYRDQPNQELLINDLKTYLTYNVKSHVSHGYLIKCLHKSTSQQSYLLISDVKRLKKFSEIVVCAFSI